MNTMRRDAVGATASGTHSLDLAGIAVPPRVQGAMAVLPRDAAALQAELLALAARIATDADADADADARAAAIADDLVNLTSQVLTAAPVEHGVFALRLFATCAPYFERVGRLAALLRLAEQVVACAGEWPGRRARRCAHQFAAVVYLQVDDARRAWAQVECAYDCSAGIDAALERFETLVLAVSVLDSMELLGDARALALQLLDFPDDEPSADTLHFVNAVNGLGLCLRSDDLETGRRFHRVAVAKSAARAAPDLDPIGARFAMLSALQQSRLGSARGAARQLDETLSRMKRPAAPRVEAMLRSAQVEVYLVLDDRVRMASSLQHLKGLLPAFDPASAFHRELLRTIIRFEVRQSGDETTVATHYLGLLRERPSLRGCESAESIEVSLQHLLNGLSDGVMDASTDTEARIDQEVATRDWARDPWRGRRFADFCLELSGGRADAAALTLPEREASLRTRAYQIAENWAVVAEIAIGGDGRQCFKVGRIAAGLAAALGLSEERAVLVELACRLRNIGDATFQGTAKRPVAPTGDTSRFVDDHTQAGARILSFSADPVLRCAARVAMNHHAWWNGSGHPSGLGGEAIPIEARICAVADRLVSLVDPIGTSRPWSIEMAIQQLRCMAGVQLDPGLVEVLASVLHDEGMRVEDSALRLTAQSWNDPFEKARKQLIETLELAA